MIRKLDKRGSYLVEAALTIPIFILSVIMLLSSLPVLSTAENTVFAMADEMRLESLKSGIRQNSYVLPVKIKGRVTLENKNQTFKITSYRYLYEQEQIQDLITVQYKQICQGYDLLNLFQPATFRGELTCRAFTGTLHKTAPSSSQGKAQWVYIFPEWGTKYHDKTCTYITGNCEMVYLTKGIKQDYQPCNLCNAKSVQVGSPVFCFFRYGEAYHVGSCRLVNRYYVEVEKSKAKSQGYTPCSKCGG